MSKKILFLVPTLRRGGAEVQLIALINQLGAADHQKYLICFDEDIDQKDQLNSTVMFHHYPRVKKYDIKSIIAIAQLIDNENIDIIHCSLQISLFFGWAARLFSKQKPKLAVTMHTTINRDLRDELFDRLLYQWLMRCCDSIIFVCEEQRRHWESKWHFIKKRSHVVHNGVDCRHFEKSLVISQAIDFRKKNRLPDDAEVIAHIAGFRPEKGHRILISAFEKLLSSRPKALLVFAGDGVLRKEMEALIEEKRLSEHVRFVGSVSDVRPLLANAAVAVIASTSVETFSIAMLEAMSMEVPLVATDIGGTREAVIPQKTGWLVPPNDIDGLASALMDALSNADNRNDMALTARQHVANNFTVEKMTEQMSNIFDTLCTSTIAR